MAGQALAIAGFIPDIELPSVPTGAPVRLCESPGRTTILIALHDAHCPGCRKYLEALASSRDEFDLWDARLLIVVRGTVAAARDVRAPFGEVVADENRRIAGPASAIILVADRYGQIFDTARADAAHDLPQPRELEEWLKYLGTLCPE